MAVQTIQALTSSQAAGATTALALIAKGEVAQALAIAVHIAGQAPQSPDAQQLLAMCHDAAGNPREAEAAFLLAVNLSRNHPLILLNLGTWLHRQGRLQHALAVARKAASVAPGLSNAWIQCAFYATSLGRLDEALAASDRAVETDPESVAAWQAKGRACSACGDYEAAETSLSRAVHLAPGNGSTWLQLAAVMRMLGRPRQAIEHLQRAAACGVASADLGDAMTGALLDDARPAEALQQARRVFMAHPEHIGAQVTLANVLWEHGPGLAPDDDPVELFRSSLAQRPRDSLLRLEFARFLLSARRADQALEHIAKLREQGDQPVLVAMEANAWEMQDDTGKAGALFQHAYESLGSGDAIFLNAYVRHLLRTRQWDRAAELAQQATAADPANQEAWAYLGTAWRLLGDEREALLCDYDRLVGLLDIAVPDGWPTQAAFLSTLATELEPLHQASREPLQQSLRNGSQTPGRLFGRVGAAIGAAQRAFRSGIEAWLSGLPLDASHPFLGRRRESVRFDGSWSVKLWSSGNHVNHVHTEGWMSSAFYVSLPPSVRNGTGDTHAGCLQFGQPPTELELGLAPRRVIRPQEGQLVVFPSYFWHGTVPFEDAQARLSIAFDMTPSQGKN